MRGRGRGGRGSFSGGNMGFNNDNQSGFNDNQSSFGGNVSDIFLKVNRTNIYGYRIKMVKNQLRILVPEMDFLEIIAAGDLTVTHAVVDSINPEDSISNEINSNRHFPVIKMTITNQFNVVVVVVAVEVAVVSTPGVAVEAASTIQEAASTIQKAALIILVVTEDLITQVVASTIQGKAVSINPVVVSTKNHHLVEAVLVVVVIMVDLAVEADSPAASVMLLVIVPHHPTTKDTIPISMIFTIM